MAKKRTSSTLQALPAAALESELRRRRKSASTLVRKRDRLVAKAAELDAQIAALGLTLGKVAGGKRFKNESTLPDALAAALKGKTMSAPEAAEAVQKSGYRTTAANFRTMVSVALGKDKRFKRVSRGQYTVR